MSNVFANKLEISGKAVNAKTIAAFPDVCFTPPEAPPTPPGVPIPYPSFGMAADTEKGTGTVFIRGKTVNIKNKSDESKTSGTEAGCATKKGIVTSKNTGKKYFHKWSNDVKFEGEPVIRFSDLATHNHASPGGNTVPTIEVCGMNLPSNADGSDCVVASYSEGSEKCQEQSQKTGKKMQFHHIIPDRTFRCDRTKTPNPANKSGVSVSNKRMDTDKFPSRSKGVCICLPEENHVPTSTAPPGTPVVHTILDGKLSALGSLPGTDPGCCTVAQARGKSIEALGNLAKNGVITADCYKIAVEKVTEQTDPIKNEQVRAEYSLKNLSQSSRNALCP